MSRRKKYFFENLLAFTPLRNGYLITFEKMQKQRPEKFCEKSVLNNFAIFTGKHLCLSLFLRGESHIDFCTHCVIMTLAGWRLLVMTLKNYRIYKFLNCRLLQNSPSCSATTHQCRWSISRNSISRKVGSISRKVGFAAYW